MLDQFTPARPAAPAAPPPSAAPKFGPAPPPADEDDDPLMGLSEEQFGDEFAQELAKSMERLMSDLAAESGLDASGADLGRATGPDGERTAADEERDRKLQAAWEAMLIEGMNGQMDMGSMGGRAVSEKKAGPALPSKDVASGPSSDSFQDSIRKAMDKLKQSESSHQVRTVPAVGWVYERRYRPAINLINPARRTRWRRSSRNCRRRKTPKR